ncbi:MAG: hypothetical protein KFH87_12190 [Bacteroidetes bacterium]|nr:hypothetical protein [Bacteroidota bacterium]
MELTDNPDRTNLSIEEELGLYQGAIRHWRQALEADSDQVLSGEDRIFPVNHSGNTFPKGIFSVMLKSHYCDIYPESYRFSEDGELLLEKNYNLK